MIENPNIKAHQLKMIENPNIKTHQLQLTSSKFGTESHEYDLMVMAIYNVLKKMQIYAEVIIIFKQIFFIFLFFYCHSLSDESNTFLPTLFD